MPISDPFWEISEISSGCRPNSTAGMKKVGAPSYFRRDARIVCKASRIGASETPKRVNTVPSRLVKLCAPLVLMENETRFIDYPLAYFGVNTHACKVRSRIQHKFRFWYCALCWLMDGGLAHHP